MHYFESRKKNPIYMPNAIRVTNDSMQAERRGLEVSKISDNDNRWGIYSQEHTTKIKKGKAFSPLRAELS